MNKLRNVKLPALWKLNSFKKKMDQFFTVLQNSMGYYVEPIEKITYVLTEVYNKLDKNIKENTFDLLISGDGMQLTRTLTNTVNFTLKVLNEKDLNQPLGIYTLGK